MNRFTEKSWRLGLAAILLAVGVPLLAAEGALRLLPVHSGLMSEPVDEANPVFRFKPNRDFLFSRDWNFAIVNRGHVNNAGFVNDQDYAREGPRPLLAVIGDSYVEAVMVPYAETVHGRLAAAARGHGRVYSFGASGAPLSQYLVWARFARETYAVDRLAVVVVGNDFDESLRETRNAPGLHQYALEGNELVLRRTDFRPSPFRGLVYASALARYLVFNLRIQDTLGRLPGIIRAARADQAFVGNVAAAADARRLALSETAVMAFFRDLPAYSGLAPDRVLFVLDGIRDPDGDPGGTSYFSRMRRFFMAEAARRGYRVIDMDESFHPAARANPAVRFSWPVDGHWNGLAHGMAAETVVRSGAFPELFGRPAP
jgi:hypothetical protein